jgi:hypothetical protein
MLLHGKLLGAAASASAVVGAALQLVACLGVLTCY